MVDASDLKSAGDIRVGSSPTLGTILDLDIVETIRIS